MKRLSLSLFIVLTLFLTTSCSYSGDMVIKVQDLPDTETYEIDGHYVDLGISFKEEGVDILGLTIPDKIYGDIKYVLYYKSKMIEFDSYNWHSYSLDQDDVQFFVDVYGIPPEPQLNWWHRWGGKVILYLFYAVCGIIALLFLWVFLKGVFGKE